MVCDKLHRETESWIDYIGAEEASFLFKNIYSNLKCRPYKCIQHKNHYYNLKVHKKGEGETKKTLLQ